MGNEHRQDRGATDGGSELHRPVTVLSEVDDARDDRLSSTRPLDRTAPQREALSGEVPTLHCQVMCLLFFVR